MKFKRTLCGLVAGLALYAGQPNSLFALENEPMIPKAEKMQTDEERRALLKEDFQVIVNREIDGKKQNIEWNLYSKEGGYFIFGASYKPEFLPNNFRFNAHHFEEDRVSAVGFDWYKNTYVPFLSSSPFIQISLGMSYFDKVPDGLVSNLEFRTSWKSGFLKDDGFYIMIGVDHWSNAGLIKKPPRKNKGRNPFGVTIGKIY